jgi:hypothetical protein
MSMDQDSKPTITVERLIALKRHEQPPPGYFHLLPGRIINRIERGEGQYNSWLKWRPSFSARPALAFALGLAVCGAMTFAIYMPLKMDRTITTNELPSDDRWAAASAGAPATVETSFGATAWLGSTNPVTAPQNGDSLFDAPGARAIPVSLFQQE